MIYIFHWGDTFRTKDTEDCRVIINVNILEINLFLFQRAENIIHKYLAKIKLRFSLATNLNNLWLKIYFCIEFKIFMKLYLFLSYNSFRWKIVSFFISLNISPSFLLISHSSFFSLSSPLARQPLLIYSCQQRNSLPNVTFDHVYPWFESFIITDNHNCVILVVRTLV